MSECTHRIQPNVWVFSYTKIWSSFTLAHTQSHTHAHTQDYNTSKMLEHGLKSLVHDSYAVSVTNPHTYAHRFQSFLMSIVS